MIVVLVQIWSLWIILGMTQLSSEKPELFKGRHFNHLLIIQAVRWYVTYLRHEVASITVKTARAGLHPLFHQRFSTGMNKELPEQ